MNNGAFDFNLFIKESKDLLLNPKLYFSTMKTSGGLGEPLIKAVIYGGIAGAFSFFWSLLNLTAAGSMFGSSVGVMILVSTIIAAVLGLFIGAVILLIISSICKGNTDYEANARVTAAVLIVMPIGAFLGFAGAVNLYFGAIVTLFVNVFAVWLLFNGLTESLKTKPETTKIVAYILIGLFVLIMALSLRNLSKMDKFMNENKDMRELMKDLDKR